MMESTHGAIADAPPPSENGSMTQTTYFDADPPPEAEGEAAQEPAERIAANAPLSVAASKAMVYASADRGWHDALDEADRIWEPVYLSADAQEGPRAFREKRPPQWQGR